MLPGFNHNLRHRNVVFHVQTEDCGLSNPMIVTHLFVGGNIIATRRSSYQKFIDKPGRNDVVAAMMQEQHKQMLKDLVNDRLRAANQYLEGIGEVVKKEDPTPVEIVGVPPASAATTTPEGEPLLDTSKATVGKSLDELILEFLGSEESKKK